MRVPGRSRCSTRHAPAGSGTGAGQDTGTIGVDARHLGGISASRSAMTSRPAGRRGLVAGTVPSGREHASVAATSQAHTHQALVLAEKRRFWPGLSDLYGLSLFSRIGPPLPAPTAAKRRYTNRGAISLRGKARVEVFQLTRA
ncbi:MAG: hypothetical protein CVU59_05820 [Deltaproteobacteria bacterium HGW-Deltaproteobacteria-17]|nr:MAG: hypothetical protein CVU59_05820 [Deltaproteobacteria bacterium HGW-Deltaproteobacteria-17]